MNEYTFEVWSQKYLFAYATWSQLSFASLEAILAKDAVEALKEAKRLFAKTDHRFHSEIRNLKKL